MIAKIYVALINSLTIVLLVLAVIVFVYALYQLFLFGMG